MRSVIFRLMLEVDEIFLIRAFYYIYGKVDIIVIYANLIMTNFLLEIKFRKNIFNMIFRHFNLISNPIRCRSQISKSKKNSFIYQDVYIERIRSLIYQTVL